MDEEVVIVPYQDGPYLVRGPVALHDQMGQPIEASRRTVALCRCGKSRMRPFCDGTHQLLPFRADSAAEKRWGGAELGVDHGGARANGSTERDAGAASGRVALPAPRGPWTAALYALLLDGAWPDAELPEVERPLQDDDLQLALYLSYEMHYGGLAGVDEWLEWDPRLLTFRAALEQQLARGIDAAVGPDERRRASVGEELQRLVQEDHGPPLSRYVESQATLQQVLEHVVHRSAYQLKEADPHSWAIPRLTGGPKAALVEIQADEYGGGRAERMHSALFAQAMRGLGLDDAYGAYVGLLPGITLATVNLMSWFGLHRRMRGALVGHLAVFEMTSSLPNRRYGNGLRRLGYGPEVTLFYDEHVEADAVHESIAAWDLADGLARLQPALADDIVFGARALLALEGLWAEHLLGCWNRDDTSLIQPLNGR